MTDTSVARTDEINPDVYGHFVGDKLYWKIGNEDVSDEDLRQWVRNNLPEGCFNSTDLGIVAFHTRAYANRRQAIGDFMRTLKWA